MSRKENTEKILDDVLHILIAGSAIGAAITLPGIMVALEKPLERHLNEYDKRQREREAKRVIYYMKSKGYLAGEYEHGLIVTKEGKKRLEQLDLDNLAITEVEKWDKLWRIVIYDIPEQYKNGRQTLSAKLRELGFFQLQKSAWIHPLPCRDVIEKICSSYGIKKYVSYIEVLSIDNQTVLISRFQKRLTKTKF